MRTAARPRRSCSAASSPPAMSVVAVLVRCRRDGAALRSHLPSTRVPTTYRSSRASWRWPAATWRRGLAPRHQPRSSRATSGDEVEPTGCRHRPRSTAEATDRAPSEAPTRRSIVGEEGTQRTGTSGLSWYLDPDRRHDELPLPGFPCGRPRSVSPTLEGRWPVRCSCPRPASCSPPPAAPDRAAMANRSGPAPRSTPPSPSSPRGSATSPSVGPSRRAGSPR